MDDFMVDWLHTVDKGVAPDVVDNVFKEVMDMMPGVNENERRQQLWLKMKHYYDSSVVPNRLTKMKKKHVTKDWPGTPPGMQGSTMQISHSIFPALGL
jgi:hypothetical protein